MKILTPLDCKQHQLTHFHKRDFSYQGFLKLLFLNNTIHMLSCSEENMQNDPNQCFQQERKKNKRIIPMPFLFFFFLNQASSISLIFSFHYHHGFVPTAISTSEIHKQSWQDIVYSFCIAFRSKLVDRPSSGQEPLSVLVTL